MNAVELWIVSTEEVKLNKDKIFSMIAPHYQKKSDEMKHETGKLQELGAGYLMAKVLGVQEDEKILCSEHGKLMLISGKKQFNLSHEKEYVVLGTSEETVGVDIQKQTEYKENVVNRFFPECMKREFEQILDPEEKDNLFTKDWTIIEAVLKCDGRGFTIPREEIKAMIPKYYTQTVEFDGHYITCACREDFEIKLMKI